MKRKTLRARSEVLAMPIEVKILSEISILMRLRRFKRVNLRVVELFVVKIYLNSRETITRYFRTVVCFFSSCITP